MKISIISTIQNYEWAGTEEVWAQFAGFALAAGHEIHVSLSQKVAASKQIQQLRKQGLQVSIRRPFRPRKIYLLKEKYWSSLRAISRFAPDILLINSGSLFDVLNLPEINYFCSKTNIPKLFFCHFVAEGFIPQEREYVRQFCETIDSWIFVSQHNKKLAERQLAYKFPNSQIVLNKSRLYLEAPLPNPNNSVVQFACIARLETLWKGQDILLEVLSQHQWKDRAWHLNFYGNGPDGDYINMLVRHYKLEKRVTCHGYVRDIKSIWNENNLMVLASRGEGTPLAVLEAMMCGRPVVTTDVGGNKEILEEKISGWIAEAATPSSFQKSLEQAWSEMDSWRDKGIAAHLAAKKLAQDKPEQKILDYILENVSCETR